MNAFSDLNKLTTYDIINYEILNVETLNYFLVSCALVLHATQFIPITLMGFYYVYKEGLSLKQLDKAAQEDNEYGHE